MKPIPKPYWIVVGPDGERADGTHLYGSALLAKRVAQGRPVKQVQAVHPMTVYNGEVLDRVRARLGRR